MNFSTFLLLCQSFIIEGESERRNIDCISRKLCRKKLPLLDLAIKKRDGAEAMKNIVATEP
jgi:hypothetical protein